MNKINLTRQGTLLNRRYRIGTLRTNIPLFDEIGIMFNGFPILFNGNNILSTNNF